MSKVSVKAPKPVDQICVASEGRDIKLKLVFSLEVPS